MKNNCTVINTIVSTVGSVGDVLRVAGIEKED